MTGFTAKQVIGGVARDRNQRRFHAPADLAIGALEIPVDVRLKVVKALSRRSRQLKRRLLFHLALLQVEYLLMQSLAFAAGRLGRVLGFSKQ